MNNTVFKFQYSTIEERETILNQNMGNRLLEEQNIVEGNFLIFQIV